MSNDNPLIDLVGAIAEVFTWYVGVAVALLILGIWLYMGGPYGESTSQEAINGQPLGSVDYVTTPGNKWTIIVPFLAAVAVCAGGYANDKYKASKVPPPAAPVVDGNIDTPMISKN